MISPFLKQTWVVTGVLINIVGLGLVFSYPYCLMPALTSPDSEIHADVNTASWLASSVGITGFFGVATSSYLMERYGRKLAHLITMVPMVVGWTLIYFAKTITWIMIGRLLCGYVCGCTVILGAVVIGEYTSPEHRGLFLNLKTTATAVGFAVIHFVAQYTDWRTVALYCLVPFLFAIINILTWPESPSWLASKHRFEESKKSFFWLREASEESIKEFEALIKQQSGVVKTEIGLTKQILMILKKFTQKNFLKPLFILWIAFFLLEAGGRHYFSSFAMDIMKRMTNETDMSKSFYYVIGMDFIILIGSSFSCVLIKIMKRRTLLFFSGISSLIVLLCLIVFLYLASYGVIVNDKPWIPLVMFVLYMMLFNFGCSPIPLALLGEVFPLEHRSVGCAISGMAMSLSLVIILQTASKMFITIGVQGAFLVYALMMALCLVYLYFTLPETKNRTLLEIEEFFNHGRYLDEEKKNISSEKMLKNPS